MNVNEEETVHEYKKSDFRVVFCKTVKQMNAKVLI